MNSCLECRKERIETVGRYFCSEECENKYDKRSEMETIEDDAVICPYCETEQSDIQEGGYYDASDDEFECDNCGKIFILSASTSTTFTALPTNEELEKHLIKESE